MQKFNDIKPHHLLEKELGWVRQDAQIGRGENSHPVGGRIWMGQAGCTYRTRRKLTSCWRKNFDGSNRMHRSDEKTHRLVKEEFGQVKQDAQIGRGENSPTVGGRIWTGQTGCSDRTRKLTSCWRKNFDGSSRMHTSDEEKTHQLLGEEFGRVRQDAQIRRGENSPAV
jgi:hypothetical protein